MQEWSSADDETCAFAQAAVSCCCARYVTTPVETKVAIPAPEMIITLMADNVKLMWMIADLDKMATDAGEIGLSNFLQARHEIHRKFQWKLRATSKA